MNGLLPRRGSFRIRETDADAPDFEAREARYRTHLRALDLRPDGDLLRYFGFDFFHDGTISRIAISEDAQSLSFKVEGPNVWDGARYLPPLGFTCHFQDLVQFHLSALKLDRHNDPLDLRERGVSFMYAEVDSLTEEIEQVRKRYKRPFHSLIIETRPMCRDLALIFGEVSVQADEPLAFERLLKDPSYRMPIWERDLGPASDPNSR